MSRADLTVSLPLLITSATAILLMIAIAIRRNHRVTAAVSLAGLAASLQRAPAAG